MNEVLMSGSDFPAARRRPTGVSDLSDGLCTFDQICQRKDIMPKPTPGDGLLITRGSAGVGAGVLDPFRVRERLLSGLLKTGLPFSLPPSSALPVRMRRLCFRRHATGG